MGLFTDGFKLLKKASESLYKTPKSIQETIEIMAVAENGIFEVSKNKGSKCYRFCDINYTTATEDEQIGIFERYCKFLNSLDCNYKITEFFKTVDKKRDDLLDDAEDTAPVFDFFKGDQRKIFEEAVKNLAYFGNSKTYVSDQELLKVVEEIETIVKDSKPFCKIQRLPELNKRIEELHMGLLEKEAAIMDPLVHDDFLKVKKVLIQ